MQSGNWNKGIQKANIAPSNVTKEPYNAFTMMWYPHLSSLFSLDLKCILCLSPIAINCHIHLFVWFAWQPWKWLALWLDQSPVANSGLCIPSTGSQNLVESHELFILHYTWFLAPELVEVHFEMHLVNHELSQLSTSDLGCLLVPDSRCSKGMRSHMCQIGNNSALYFNTIQFCLLEGIMVAINKHA